MFNFYAFPTFESFEILPLFNYNFNDKFCKNRLNFPVTNQTAYFTFRTIHFVL